MCVFYLNTQYYFKLKITNTTYIIKNNKNILPTLGKLDLCRIIFSKLEITVMRTIGIMHNWINAK